MARARFSHVANIHFHSAGNPCFFHSVGNPWLTSCMLVRAVERLVGLGSRDNKCELLSVPRINSVRRDDALRC